MSNNDVYYKVFLTRDNLVTVVTMQNFDEYDYDQNRFYREGGEPVRFDSEDDAIKFINERFKSEAIEPEYRRESLWEDLLK